MNFEYSFLLSHCSENEFEDGNHYYRLLEHQPFIPRCFNFQGSTSDSEPKAAAIISERLTKLMSAILESYASEDRRHLNYIAISNSEEFRRYVSVVDDLIRRNLLRVVLIKCWFSSDLVFKIMLRSV